MTALALDARGLVRRYGDVLAVDHADIAVPQGELVALLGPSGCGKTTSLRLIAGLDHGEGSIQIDGVLVSGRRPAPPEARNVGLVFQDSVLFPHLSVAANVGYGLRPRGREAEVARLLELLSIGHLAERMPHEISGGEQQRVALARTLATDPALVLLDEPFAHLDASLREQVREEMLRALSRTGTSALLVTHDQAEALAIADRVVVMRKGRVHQAGSPAEIYDRPADRFVAGFIGRATLVPAEVRAAGAASTPLGDVAVAEHTRPGACVAVVRPEAVVLVPPGHGRDGRVVRAWFRGGDHLLRVELGDGTLVEASSAAPHRSGDRVAVAVRGIVATVPADADA